MDQGSLSTTSFYFFFSDWDFLVSGSGFGFVFSCVHHFTNLTFLLGESKVSAYIEYSLMPCP